LYAGNCLGEFVYGLVTSKGIPAFFRLPFLLPAPKGGSTEILFLSVRIRIYAYAAKQLACAILADFVRLI
jgi:hypothetical protein